MNTGPRSVSSGPRRPAPAAPPLALEAHGATDIGIRRSYNEDAYVAVPAAGVFVVCDGMGGLPAGAVASRVASKAAEDALLQAGEPAHRIATAFRAAEGAIAAANAARRALLETTAVAREQLAGMATTMVAMVVVERSAVVGWAGDSRAYRMRGGSMVRLTRDHAAAPNVVTRAVGYGRDDGFEMASHPLRSGDTLLLCTDGLHHVVPEAKIRRTLADHGEVGMAADALIEAALVHGAPDNVTAVVVRVR